MPVLALDAAYTVAAGTVLGSEPRICRGQLCHYKAFSSPAIVTYLYVLTNQ